jgi:integrase
MLLRVEQGKGRKDRQAMLSPQLLGVLRGWWREGRRLGALLPRGWLFPGRNPLEPLSTRQLNRAVHAAAQAAGINIRCGTALPRIYWNRTPTSASFRYSSAMPSSTPRRFTRVLPTPRSERSPARSTDLRR